MSTKTSRKTAILLLASLTQVAACSITPPKVEQDSAASCATSQPLLASDPQVRASSDGALLVDGRAAGRNCAGVAEGSYDVMVVAQWSKGYERDALQVANLRAAKGQALVARAYERGRGEVPTSFVGVSPAKAAGLAPLPIEAGTARDDATAAGAQNTDDAAQPQEDTVAEVTPDSLAKGAALVAGAAVLGTLYAPYIPIIAAEAIKARRDTRRAMIAAERARPDCCYLWIEDARTGRMVAGARPTP